MRISIRLSWTISEQIALNDQLVRKKDLSGHQLRVRNKKDFSYFSTKTYAVGTTQEPLRRFFCRAPKTYLQFYVLKLCRTLVSM